MTLIDIINAGTALACGGIKGFCDGANIDLHYSGYIIPAIGVFTLPTTLRIVEGEDQPFLKNSMLGGVITMAGYAVGRGVGVIVDHYQ